MRQLAPDWTIDSAGTSDWHEGDPPYGPMQAAAKGKGIDLQDLRARHFTAADFDRFDVIVAMDAKNMANIEALRPSGNTTPVRLLAETDVPDPYYTRDFDGGLEMISAAAVRLRDDISRSPDQ